MSMGEKLGWLLTARKLVERPTPFLGYETARVMIVSPEIAAVTTEPFADTTEGERCAEFAQWLDAFSEGNALSVSEDCINKPPDTMLARICPETADFWAIRVTDPEHTPGIRALGAFAEKDTFIALSWHLRELMSFDDDAAEIANIWHDYFGDTQPYHGSTIDDYLTTFIVAE